MGQLRYHRRERDGEIKLPTFFTERIKHLLIKAYIKHAPVKHPLHGGKCILKQHFTSVYD